ncbi:MAG: hypothetical protein C4523_18515 [Myxococcales bacterium]|nr:MAG: hypothetical protein C4523_18515 [Myxococcales bacterium]
MVAPKPSRRRLKLILGVALGGLAGFAYYYFIGCQSGGCPITSSPYISTGYGAVFGALMAWS